MKLKTSGDFMSAVHRKAVKKCVGFAWGATLFLITTANVSAEEIRQRQTVGDVEIVLSVPHAVDSPESDTEFQTKHHLVIWLFKKGSSKTIEGAHVKAYVAEVGFAGVETLFKPVKVDGKSAYSGVFAMPDRVAYRINVQIKRPGELRVIEAVFEYRHHHKLR